MIDFLILVTLVYIINIFFKKNNFLLDASDNENFKHKVFVSNTKFTPVSGGIIFLTIICSYYYNILNLTIFISLITFVGILSDLKKLNSPKIRFFAQVILIFLFLFFNSELFIITRIGFLDDLMSNPVLNHFFIAFCILTLVNGFNFIDGVNLLSSLNALILILFIWMIDVNGDYLSQYNLTILIKFLIIFCLFNFFNKMFLGDGGAYGISFLLGYFLILIHMRTDDVSPYYIFNLLWYPVFENLFTILRRSFFKREKILADNLHLHHLIYLKLKNFLKNQVLSSSMTGILINLYLLNGYILGYVFKSKTNIQVLIIILNSIAYLLIYYSLYKSKNQRD